VRRRQPRQQCRPPAPPGRTVCAWRAGRGPETPRAGTRRRSSRTAACRPCTPPRRPTRPAATRPAGTAWVGARWARCRCRGRPNGARITALKWLSGRRGRAAMPGAAGCARGRGSAAAASATRSSCPLPPPLMLPLTLLLMRPLCRQRQQWRCRCRCQRTGRRRARSGRPRAAQERGPWRCPSLCRCPIERLPRPPLLSLSLSPVVSLLSTAPPPLRKPPRSFPLPPPRRRLRWQHRKGPGGP